MSNPVQKGFSGWLIKRGGFNKGWKKRWFSYKQPRMTRTQKECLQEKDVCSILCHQNTKPMVKS